jgi:hypothetical protein
VASIIWTPVPSISADVLVRRGGIEPPTRGFSVPEVSLETLEDFQEFGTACPANVRSIAVAQLEAVAEGRATDAAQLSERLAETVLTSPLFRTALAVREGGALAIARAVQLAEMVLRRNAGASGTPQMAANALSKAQNSGTRLDTHAAHSNRCLEGRSRCRGPDRGPATRLSCPADSRGCGSVGSVRGIDRHRLGLSSLPGRSRELNSEEYTTPAR